jgi:hypothetical protein
LLGLQVGATFANAVLINFDDRPGLTGGFAQGTPVPPEYLISTQYEGLGVRFGSGGGGVALCAPSNPVSPPNTVSATGPGPVISFTMPVTAAFFISGDGAVVDSVSLTLTNSSGGHGPIVLTAYGVDGSVLGSDSTQSPSVTLHVGAAGQIHQVVLSGQSFAFDNFQFEGLSVPCPSAAVFCGIGLIGACRRRRSA